MSGNDIDRTLADWFKADALAHAPPDGVERALVGARRRTPRPGWLAGPGSHWVGDTVWPSSGSATLGRTGLRTSTALLLLLLVLALVSGAVLVGARLLQPAPSTVPPAADQLVLSLDSSREGGNDLAVYADGRVIWGPYELGDYLKQRLTPEGLERLRSKVLSTGLFERNLFATSIGTDIVGRGSIKVLRGDRPAIAAWGATTGADVSGDGLEDRWVRASSAQAAELMALEAFLGDPTTWEFADDAYVQHEITPFVPSHFWVSWDRGRPDWSQLPSPAREVVTRIMDGCANGLNAQGDHEEFISIDQAREMEQVLTQAGVRTDYDDRLGLSFSLPTSFVHTHPALPHDVVVACGE
jgi:hypothetical protein